VISFHQLYESYAEDVYRFAFSLSGTRIDAEDITSETFIRAWVKHDSIRTETLKAYLFTIARNLYLESMRKKPQQIPLEDFYQDPKPNPERIVEAAFDLMDVHKFLQTVSEIDRTAFVMRVQHELPYAEIARCLELTESAAKVKVHRVRRKLLAWSINQKEVST
jgi:RNA polymerase sigma-70 factor (ECF subfamily)